MSKQNHSKLAAHSTYYPTAEERWETEHPEHFAPALSAAQLYRLCGLQNAAMKKALLFAEPLRDELTDRNALYPEETKHLAYVCDILLDALVTSRKLLCAWNADYREVFQILHDEAQEDGTPPHFL